MNNSEFLDDTEQDVSESHSKLLEAVAQLDRGQRVKKAQRSEPTLEVSEFHLVKSGISDKDAVHIHDLTKALGKKGHHFDISRNIETLRKKVNVLPKPLEKPAAEKIKRIVGFKNTKEEVRKWNAVITRNRAVASIHFPLNQSSMQFESEYVKRFRLQSELEKELAALEPQKENIEKPEDEFTLNLKEIAMKRKEAAKIRAQQSYKEAKARRQGKIKSKKFHRIQKKERVKLQLKEFEELQKVNPQAALEKLELLDKTRAEERMSLRHKNTGKWAKSKQIRAKYDKETQQELAEQLSVGRELTQKLRKLSDDEEEVEDDNVATLVNNKENPWVGNTKTESEITDFIESYRKYWDKQNNQLKDQKLDVENQTHNRRLKATSENSKSFTTFEDECVNNLKPFEVKGNKKVVRTKKSNKHEKMLTENLKPLPSFEKDQDTTRNTELLEVQSHKEDSEMVESNNENVIQISHDKIVKRKILKTDANLNKKAKLQEKAASSTISTSDWSVESVENSHTENAADSLRIGQCKNVKINEIFDYMEETMKEKIKSKSERIKKKYSKITKKHTSKSDTDVEKENFDGLELRAEKQKPILDSALDESISRSNPSNAELEHVRNMEHNNNDLSVHKSNTSEIEIDPNKYINVKPKKLNTELPAVITGGDDVLDDSDGEKEKRNIISEAFADDDVVDEFRKEKEEVIKRAQPQDIDLTLPGWGSWTGKNVKMSKRKNKRLIFKVPKEIPRKDENKGDVIIFEEDKPKIKEHQVNELPYPFTSVKDYEASIRMPIGRNFVPENAHRKLVTPAVKTDMGRIIEPMSEELLVKIEKKKQRNFLLKSKLGVKKQRIKLPMKIK